MDKLNLMNSFVHVAELQSYTAAASKLNKTKALMSTHVRQLEEALDVRLISRSTRGFTLTEAGQRYYHQARQILDEVAAMEIGLREGEQQMAGRLRLSVPNTFGEEVMMPFIADFMQRYPAMNIEVELNDRYVDLINSGFDLAIRLGQLQDSAMVARPIGVSYQVLVAAPKLVADKPTQDPDDIAGLPMIFDTNIRGERTRWVCHRDDESFPLDLHIVAYVNSAKASGLLARSGIGLALCPAFAVQSGLDSGELVELLPEYQFGKIPISAVYPNRQQLSARARQFIDEFKAYITPDS
ncbi:LysR substrate-binding domain-containing protein [Celerinatantimonas sp. YJH-8]|uniref:LysR family transcriptional regulator n=1 Tax=Celerinatantimonas sp. YJH-8 TaxID=3228714 RepID=UPI0038C655F9